MKNKKMPMLLLILFLLIPTTVSAATSDKNYLEGEVSIEMADGFAEIHLANLCIFHDYEGYRTAGDSYSNDNSSTHTHRYISYSRCKKCGNEKSGAVEKVESHISRMMTAKCTGSHHIIEYACVCGRNMGSSRVDCPRPGNCPGLPLSILLETE